MLTSLHYVQSRKIKCMYTVPSDRKIFCFMTQVKPLKELRFNSPNITATMTSRQFQVMLDVLSNLLFARLPK
jgi:hypothetical protein